MTTGDVELTIVDGGASIVVPSESVQAVLGCASGGTVGQAVATRNVNTLASIFGDGPLVQAGAITIAKGGTVIACRVTSATPGALSAVVPNALTGTSVITVTGTPLFSYFAKVKVTKGGTIATAGIRFQISLDAGRSYGPEINLGTAVTYLIPGTGVTLNFAAGTLVTDATYTFTATEPLWDAAGVQAGLNALQASPYAVSGWGSTHLPGVMSGSNATSIQGYLDTLRTQKTFTRLIAGARDLSPPTAYSGTAESEAAWSTAVLADFAAVSADRVLVTAGHYNMQSPLPLAIAGAPKYRLPLSYALAAKQVTIPPQRHAGRVRDGAVSQIVVDAANDPSDGFVYHDERLNPTFRTNRIAAARTRLRKQGWYFDDPNLLAGNGSVFRILPLGTVMDIACGIVVDVGQDEINEDVRLNRSGTIFDNDALAIENAMKRALKSFMIDANMISDAAVVVSRDVNVRDTKKVRVDVTIWARGYVLELDVYIGYGTAEAA